MTWPPTVADDPDLMAEHAVRDDAEVRPTATVEAPCCGRECAADMVVDVRGVEGIDRSFLCDGCRWRFVKVEENGWTRSSFVRALGAPPETVRSHRIKELVAEARRESGPGEAFTPEEARLAAEEELPAGEHPPGTEPPTAS